MNKKSVSHFLGLSAFILALQLCVYLGLSWYRDPLHIFQKSAPSDYLIDNMRIQAAGIINTFDFDSIILGTSVLENSSAKEMSQLLGGVFANISVSGSSQYERAIILKHALRQKQIKKVVYSLDDYYLYLKTASYDEKNWTYLYDDILLNDFKVYLNLHQMKNILFNIKKGHLTNLDRPNAWFKNEYHACRFGGLDNWIKHRDKQGVGEFLSMVVPDAARKAKQSNVILHDKILALQACEYIEKYVLKIAELHPKTEFYFIFPPYWRFHYAVMKQTTLFSVHQEVIRYIIHRSKNIKNISIFGFEDCNFVDDISNYKDVTHYSLKINEYISSCIQKKEHMLTIDNIEEYLNRCNKKACDFDLQELAITVAAKLANDI